MIKMYRNPNPLLKTLALFLFTWFAGNTLFAQVSITATGGTTGPTTYTNLTDAFAAINNGTHTGAVTVTVTADLTQGVTPVLNASGTGSASYTSVLIKPGANASPTITNNADNTAGIKLDGADNVTIDGSNNGTTSQNMTFRKSGSGASGVSCNIWLASNGTNGATNNTIKNCRLIGSSYTLGAAYMGVCVYSSTSTLTGYWQATSVTTGANSNNVIRNNLFTSANMAVVFKGGAGIGETGNQVIGNTFGITTAVNNTKFTNGGIHMLNQANFLIDSNMVTWINATNTNVTPGAISIGDGCTNGTISRNRITGVRFNSSTTPSAGILLSGTAGANIKVRNNFIADVASSSTTADTAVAEHTYGIAVLSGSGYDIDFNSVLMNTNPTQVSNYQAALYLGAGVSQLNIRNNIFARTASTTSTNGTNKFSVYAANANPAGSVIDYNVYYNSGTKLGYAGSDQNTLADVQTNLQNGLNHSRNVLPVFVSATDLHLQSGNTTNMADVEGAGLNITGIGADIDGDARPATPDIGADEIVGCAGAIITQQPVADTVCSGGTAVFSVASSNGVSYQWQQNTGSGFANIANNTTFSGATTNTLTITNAPAGSNGYTYRCNITVQASCPATASAVAVLQVLPVPSFSLGNDTLLCASGSLSLSIPPAGTYLWSTGASTSTITVPAAGTYWGKVQSGNGCSYTDTIVVAAGILPAAGLGNDTTICQGISLMLNGGTAGTYAWSTGAITQTISVNTSGSYSVTLTNPGAGCADADTMVLAVTPLPVFSLGNDTAICSGGALPLVIQPAGTYTWSTGATTSGITVTAAGTYWGRALANGCTYTDTIVAAAGVMPVASLGGDLSACYGNSVTLDGGNAATYNWSTGATTQTIQVNTTGTYNVTLSNPGAGCADADTLDFTVNPLPMAGTINSSGSAPTFGFSTSGAQFVNTYSWSFGDGSPLAAGTAVSHTYTANGTYTVTLIVTNNCGKDTATATITVSGISAGTVPVSADELKLYPNPASGLVTISNVSVLKMQSLTVTNALGAVVLQKNNVDNTRDTIDVGNLAAGVYIVRIRTDKGVAVRQLQVYR